MSRALALPLGRSQPRTSRRFGRALKGCAGVAVHLLAWQLSVPIVGLGPYCEPAPTDGIAAGADLSRKGLLPVYFADRMER
jgi:hypothetical protein